MSDYSGTTVELEVARYGLRTFRQHGISPPVLSSMVTLRDYWMNGSCEAKCLANGTQTYSVTVEHDGSMIMYSQLDDDVPGSHAAPQEDCQCGIYATHTLDHLLHRYRVQANQLVTVIAAEGQTIMGDKGFRTQFARVVAYWCADNLSDQCQRQFKDAQRHRDLNDMLKAYEFPYVEKPVGVLQKIEHAMVNMFGPGSLAVGGTA